MSAEIPLMMEQTINQSVIETSRLMIDRHGLRALDAVQLASCHVARATIGVADIVFVASDKARNQDCSKGFRAARIQRHFELFSISSNFHLPTRGGVAILY